MDNETNRAISFVCEDCGKELSDNNCVAVVVKEDEAGNHVRKKYVCIDCYNKNYLEQPAQIRLNKLLNCMINCPKCKNAIKIKDSSIIAFKDKDGNDLDLLVCDECYDEFKAGSKISISFRSENNIQKRGKSIMNAEDRCRIMNKPNRRYMVEQDFAKYYVDQSTWWNCGQIGQRLEGSELMQYCISVIDNHIFRGKPDYGCALCTLIYNDSLFDVDMATTEYELYQQHVRQIDKDNPHNCRWLISCAFAIAEKYNKPDYYKMCLNYDFKNFSILILTKQTMAAIKYARHLLDCENQKDNAKCILNKTMHDVKEAFSQSLAVKSGFNIPEMIGADNYYDTYSCLELAEVLANASIIAEFLFNIDESLDTIDEVIKPKMRRL